ncbi:MAG TPA: SOS response-associated peptidase [Planctomycetota bacterium]|jgi:putative SOS response-associated peptidase YedK|nr:SOS response-associated peptidase [Planctomycetota bacterium]
MCGRIRLGFVGERLAEAFAAKLRAELLPAFNIKPTQAVVVLIDDQGERVIETMRWGLIPAWATDPKIGKKMFNAGAETVAEKPSLRSAFRSRRCGVLVDAFYEWADVDGARVPHAFRVVGAEVFALAGLWEEWISPTDEVVRSCTIVTTSVNEQVRPFHERMQVILDPPALATWIDPKATRDSVEPLLAPYAGKLMIEPTKL